MGYSFDPEIAQRRQELAGLLAGLGPYASPGDVESRRLRFRRLYEAMLGDVAPIAGVKVEQYELTVSDGARIPLYWYRPTEGELPGSAAVFLHGGGYFTGFPDMGDSYDWRCRRLVAASGVPVLLVDYRLAPEHPYPAGHEDCYAALVWLARNAEGLGVDPARIAVLGNSAGGGLTASMALLARDRGGPVIAQQLLMAPMLDDRPTVVDPEMRPFLVWTPEDNITGWHALLGAKVGASDVPIYAAPARATDLTGLPPAYIEVGGLDFLRQQAFDYASRLAAARVPVEVHSFPGCPHSFEALAPEAAVTQFASALVGRRLKSL
ncbi:esterase/lipase [Mycobacteroides abscessus subsp. massiliense]|uniref:alpha/beta hydrolase n=1 Tax=Mycobacteroides abscessus TaxID=36809 RepID=UPI0009A63481|nr:alpha/beta hydrolase [Mycobacteroides abscessus]SKF26890.1 esterase/lipase [Mycobacteroides abscessus subsp. abscessus]SKH50875.1 esterase/lipase [Mycobacteroides abscessus subsp. massiliense]SKH82608.1 esterase/lipase [Mycobacteroides abscessus subsp. massiliense]SKK35714.1 esterase/lipase [Mycobacteroides abscessus subsp. massiliense]SKK43914.1 esterase/lipase [Mycobacteroides abscessus subsp. massiliense]